MKAGQFWFLLVLISLLTGFGVILFHQFEIFRPHQTMSWLFFGFMFLFTLLLYYLGKRTSVSSDNYSFVRMVIASIMIKIILVLLALVLYVKLIEPDNRYFVFPVLAIYIIFSIFETYVLYRLALNKPKSENE